MKYYTAIVFFQDRGPVKYRNIKEWQKNRFMKFIVNHFPANKPTAANFYSKETKAYLFQEKF